MNAVRVILISALFSILSPALNAQVRDVELLYEKYSSVEQVETIKISKMMLSVVQLTNKDFPKGVSGMTMLIMKKPDKADRNIKKVFISDIEKVVSGLVNIAGGEEGGINANVYAQSVDKENDKLKNIVIYAYNSDMITLIEMLGEFDPDDDFMQGIEK